MTVGRLALRNLWRRPARTLLLICSIALAVATALALLALSRGVIQSSREGANERGADLTVSQLDASDIFSGFIDETMEARIRAVPGVIGVTGEMAMFAPVDQDHEFLVMGWSKGGYFWDKVPIAQGAVPAEDRGFVLIGENVARALGKGAGDTLTIFDRRLPIAALTGFKVAVNRGVVILPLADLQELAFRQGQVTVFHVVVDPDLPAGGVERIAGDIRGFGGVAVDPTGELLNRDRNVEIFNAIARAISIIALTMAGLSVLNVLLMAVAERTRETGIMMAIGWSRRRIMATIVAEGAIMGLLGCLAGIPLGFVACMLFNQLPTIGTYISFRPSLDVILPAVAAGIALSALGSLYPAWRAVSQTPADALRRA